jgi:hypothetical protein
LDALARLLARCRINGSRSTPVRYRERRTAVAAGLFSAGEGSRHDQPTPFILMQAK